jgi:hypothetical protein
MAAIRCWKRSRAKAAMTGGMPKRIWGTKEPELLKHHPLYRVKLRQERVRIQYLDLMGLVFIYPCSDRTGRATLFFFDFFLH